METRGRIIRAFAKTGARLFRPVRKVKDWSKAHQIRRQRHGGQDAEISRAGHEESDASHGQDTEDGQNDVPAQEDSTVPTDSQNLKLNFKLDGQSDADFIRGESRIVDASHDCYPWLAIHPSIELVNNLNIAVKSHIRIKEAESIVSAELQILLPKYRALQDEIRRSQLEVEKLESKASHAASEDLQSKRTCIDRLMKDRDQVYDRQNELRGNLRELYEGLRDEQFGLFDMLEDLLVKKNKVSDSLAEFPADDQDAESNASCAADNAFPTRSIVNTYEGSVNTVICNKSIRIRDREADADRGSRVQKAVIDREKLIDEFNKSKRELIEAEYQLANRDTGFIREAELARRAIETVSEMQVRHFDETRRMTRVVIRAEARHEEAKDSLIAAGIQPPGSDLESGFVDDASDGYRTSFEQELVVSVDRDSVRLWLDRVPEACWPFCESDVSQVQDADLEPWCAKEVEIWESRSMLAEGPARRRIDKWCAMLASARGTK